jgi:hypothetical protein|tara:strand:+ start:950 stop:2674 length:1725 start_codon:yes stop_codon:yes gene_type:complete
MSDRAVVPSASAELARASSPSSTTRARVEVDAGDDARVTALGFKRFLWPIHEREFVRDVRARIAGAFRARGLLAEDAFDASEVRLEIDGYELLDECLARDVVRDDDVVRARRRADAGRRADARASPRAIGEIFQSEHRPLAPAVSDGEEEGARTLRLGDDGGASTKRSRSAKRKSNKRAKRRVEFDTLEDLQVVSDSTDEENCEAGRAEERRRKKTTYAPEPLPDYDAKPKPKRAGDYVHISTPYVPDPESDAARILAKRDQFRRDVRESGAGAWELNVFRSELPDDEVREFPTATTLKRSDFIAYKLRHPTPGVSGEYYQGRVMHFDPVTREVRVKPMPEDRVTAAGHLFFKLRQRAPEPFNKLGELIGNFDEVMHDVRLIGGRSVWEGDVPSKTWTPGRVYQKPPGWQPGQRETNEEYEEWLEEHIKIHEYQMANARKWDEKIVRGDRNWRDGDGASRRRPHRHERARQQREREEEREREEAHRWPTSAEELQAKLMAEWKAEEAANTLASPAAAPKPGGLPPRIPGVEQPPPPPGSPPKPTTARKKSPETRRARRASTAAAVAMFRDSGDI